MAKAISNPVQGGTPLPCLAQALADAGLDEGSMRAGIAIAATILAQAASTKPVSRVPAPQHRLPLDFGLDAYDRLAEAEERGTAVSLIDPRGGAPLLTKDGRPVTITVRGLNSATAERVLSVAQHDRLAEAPDHGQEVEAAEIEALACLTVAWCGLTMNGEEIAFDEAAVRSVYRRFPWIRQQIASAAQDQSRFLAPAG